MFRNKNITKILEFCNSAHPSLLTFVFALISSPLLEKHINSKEVLSKRKRKHDNLGANRQKIGKVKEQGNNKIKAYERYKGVEI